MRGKGKKSTKKREFPLAPAPFKGKIGKKFLLIINKIYANFARSRFSRLFCIGVWMVSWRRAKKYPSD